MTDICLDLHTGDNGQVDVPFRHGRHGHIDQRTIGGRPCTPERSVSFNNLHKFGSVSYASKRTVVSLDNHGQTNGNSNGNGHSKLRHNARAKAKNGNLLKILPVREFFERLGH